MKALKPWLSLDDQLTLLQERGLIVEDTQAALSYLKRLGYYRLSGYWYLMRTIDHAASAIQGKPVRSDGFTPNSRFEDVVRLYIFDKKLRLLALDALERIEMALRVDIAHLLGQKDSLAHENPAYLHGNFTKKLITSGLDAGKTQHDIWLAKYRLLLRRANKEPFVVHHQKNYGSLPIWAAIEIWDFGLLSKLFAGMQYSDQQHIAALYNAPNGQTLAKWLRSLNFIRNVSAHHSRLWNINVLELSPTPREWPQLNRAKPFLYFCLMQHLLKVVCPNSSWGRRFQGLLANDFPNEANQTLSQADMGILPGWEKWELWS